MYIYAWSARSPRCKLPEILVQHVHPRHSGSPQRTDKARGKGQDCLVYMPGEARYSLISKRCPSGSVKKHRVSAPRSSGGVMNAAPRSFNSS